MAKAEIDGEPKEWTELFDASKCVVLADSSDENVDGVFLYAGVERLKKAVKNLKELGKQELQHG